MNILEPQNNYYYRDISSSEIESQSYELLLRQLEVCLNMYKPHFELQYKYIGVNSGNQEFEYEEKRYCLNLIVFDKLQNVKKKLVVFDNNYRNEKLIKYYIDLLKYFPRKDLIYLLYDSYYLDSKKTFYIFELECPKTINFSNFMDYFDIVENTVEKIKTAFCDQLIEFDKTQLVKQFRSKDKNKFCLLDQDYLLKIFQNKKIVYYKHQNVKEQLYFKKLIQIPLGFCFAQFEDFEQHQQQKQPNQDESQSNIDIEDNEDSQSENSLEQQEEFDKDSIYSSLFDEDSLFNQNCKINNLIKNNEEDKDQSGDILCDSNTNQNIKQIDDHSLSQESLQQSQEQTMKIDQEELEISQQDKLVESQQNQIQKTDFNTQEANLYKDRIQDNQNNSRQEINIDEQNPKIETEEFNEKKSQSIQEDQDSNQDEIQQEQQEEVKNEIESVNEDQNSDASSYWNTDQDLVNQLLDFNERILITIKKENLIDKIKEFYSDILNYHNEDIFSLIQQHPKYDDFEVLSYNSEQFKLKCKKDNDMRILLVKKFSCFQKIQEEEKLINQQSSIINNLIVTEIILQEKYSYLLVEQKYFQPSKRIYFYPTIQDLLKSFSTDRNFKLYIIELLMQLSYELFCKFNIKVTNICPSKIFIQGNIDTIQQKKKFNIIIQELSTENFEKQYLDLIKSPKDYYGYQKFYQKNCTVNLETLLNQFFNDLNVKSKQEISNLYSEITQHIYLLMYIHHNREISITKNNKFHKYFRSYRSIELTKDQQLVVSLEIKFEDYINWSVDVQQENLDLYNSLFKQQQQQKQQWSLPFEQQEQFEKHFVKFQSYFKLEKNQKIEDNKNEEENEMELEIPSQNQLQENNVDNNQEYEAELSLLTELKNMLTICFEHNLKKKTNFKLEIVNSNTIDFKSYYTYYDYDYYNISSEFIKESSKILQLDIKKYNSQASFNFAYLYIDNQTQGLSHLIDKINLNRNINTVALKKNDYYEEITFQQKQFRKQIFKLKRLVVFDRHRMDEQLQN
ncbi:hypothetical protein TTHERM_01186290 (macronuclear) [Tetrahymena thermophila SB210]|uniref:Uncharacterized protein n=1 Tax=Tetrahymena thermophila (strain SB210) TaxID=312017 RepID=Q23RQ8_TETTS|nr:hypothetical protein TTHERM_01186290 [Tetrahymena thermophila SB210]EAR99227.3 hypothetical protein TTHERM_01186290 [Tetrahymena thermophila SB210]|eukprot:XP_001019472.3 hypothetical protein TTHERM_01186290 [Tetrahymena thermophila SB210]